MRGDVTPGRWLPGSSSPIKPVSRNATAAFTPTRKAASGRLDPPCVALFRPSVVTLVQQPDPRASCARGVARHKLGPGRGAGQAQGDVTPRRWRLGSSSPIKPVSQNATSSLHAHSEGCFGEAGPPRVALFVRSVITQVQQHDPRQVALVAWLDLSPGGKRGGAGARACEHQQMAAGVLKPNQACLPECKQKPSLPLRRLLRRDWTPTCGPIRG